MSQYLYLDFEACLTDRKQRQTQSALTVSARGKCPHCRVGFAVKWVSVANRMTETDRVLCPTCGSQLGTLTSTPWPRFVVDSAEFAAYLRRCFWR